jgi:hypothetical protein
MGGKGTARLCSMCVLEMACTSDARDCSINNQVVFTAVHFVFRQLRNWPPSMRNPGAAPRLLSPKGSQGNNKACHQRREGIV